jgi:hypothetical protein
MRLRRDLPTAVATWMVGVAGSCVTYTPVEFPPSDDANVLDAPMRQPDAHVEAQTIFDASMETAVLNDAHDDAPAEVGTADAADAGDCEEGPWVSLVGPRGVAEASNGSAPRIVNGDAVFEVYPVDSAVNYSRFQWILPRAPKSVTLDGTVVFNAPPELINAELFYSSVDDYGSNPQQFSSLSTRAELNSNLDSFQIGVRTAWVEKTVFKSDKSMLLSAVLPDTPYQLELEGPRSSLDTKLTMKTPLGSVAQTLALDTSIVPKLDRGVVYIGLVNVSSRAPNTKVTLTIKAPHYKICY